MPKADFYAGLPLPDALERFADHHHERENRHISEDEYRLLIRAARELADKDDQAA